MKMTATQLLLTGMAAALCLSAHAAEPQAATADVTVAGMKVGIDAKTGRLRPLTEVESQQLDQALTQGRQPQRAAGLSRSFQRPADEAAARLTARALAGGGVAVKLPETQMSTLALHRDSAGQLLIEHTDAAGDAVGPEEQVHE